ncbi:MAG: GntR family transcriptional regulator [Actinobacteria bacterium]|nr:MAG: GntR family transcriptional regulator [Actinomycetota bacterium]
MSRLAESAYEKLRGQILSGERVHGERLTEVDVAEDLGISRTPVREALRRLAAEGLVDVSLNRGASVARWGSADLQEIFDLRTILESDAAKRATTRAGSQVIVVLDELCQEMDEIFANLDGIMSLRSLAELNRRFHSTIIEAAESPRLSSIIDSLTHVPVVMQTFAQYSPHALARSLQHHREIVDAMRARDASWAENVMRAHIIAARYEVLGVQPR